MFIPIGDENARNRITPLITYALIAANVLVFFLELNQGSQAALQTFFERWGVIPTEYHDMTDEEPFAPGPYWVTLFSAMFMHGGIAHIFGNMLFLWIFGDNIENALGRLKFLLFYLVCGVIASLAHILFNINSDVPSLGASGAISGVLGAYLVLHPTNRIRMLFLIRTFHIPAWLMIGTWILLQFVNQFAAMGRTEQTEGVAYMAHIGGFVAGVVLILLFRLAGAVRRTPAYAGFPTRRAWERGFWD